MPMRLLFVLAVTLFSGPVLPNEEARFFVGKRGGNRIPYKLSLPDETVHEIAARAPDKAKGAVFTGWTSTGGTVVKDTTTHPTTSKGTFRNARARTTTFTMPANDVIVTANYAINRK